jgi:hypothetical protein
MPCAQLPRCIGLFDQPELEPTTPTVLFPTQPSRFAGLKRSFQKQYVPVSVVGGWRCYLLGYDSGIGVRVPALGGEAGERVRVQPAGEGDAWDDGDTEQRKPPGGDEPNDEPGQERREVVDEVANLHPFHFRQLSDLSTRRRQT